MIQFYQASLRSLLILALLLPLGTARAADQTRELLTSLGFDVLLADIPGVMANSIDQKRKETGELTPARAEALTRQFQARFKPADLMTDIARLVEKRVSANHRQQVANLLASPQGKKLLALQQAASTDQAFEEIRALANRHKDEALSPERQNLLETLDDASARTEFFIATQALAVYAIMNGFHKLGLQTQDTSNADAVLNLIYQQLHRPSRYTVFLTLRYTFRDVPDQELMDYVRMYRFGPMQKFLQAVMGALQEVLMQRSSKIAEELKKQ